MSSVTLPRLLSLLLLTLLGAACRSHDLAEGQYELVASSVTEDGCGLVAAGGGLGTVTLRTYGNELQGHLDLLGFDLDGRYLRGEETFRVAGSGTDVDREVAGVACRVQLIQVVLVASTNPDGTVIEGPLTITFDDARNPACVCVLEAQVRGDWFAPPG